MTDDLEAKAREWLDEWYPGGADAGPPEQLAALLREVRDAERAAVVAYMRDGERRSFGFVAKVLRPYADAIERGEHREGR